MEKTPEMLRTPEGERRLERFAPGMTGRSEKAASFFLDGYNCCQSVALAFEDVINERAGLTREQIVAMCSGFGGGIARMRETCGCVSGMTLVAGLLQPAPAAPAGDKAAMDLRHSNYALIRSLAEEFRSAQGSIVCRELLGLRAEGATAAGASRDVIAAALAAAAGTAAASPTTPAASAIPDTDTRPSERTPEYYKSRPCAGLVACAAGILANKFGL